MSKGYSEFGVRQTSWCYAEVAIDSRDWRIRNVLLTALIEVFEDRAGEDVLYIISSLHCIRQL